MDSGCPKIDRFIGEVFAKDAIPLAWENLGDLITLDRSVQKPILPARRGRERSPARSVQMFAYPIRWVRAITGCDRITAEGEVSRFVQVYSVCAFVVFGEPAPGEHVGLASSLSSHSANPRGDRPPSKCLGAGYEYRGRASSQLSARLQGDGLGCMRESICAIKRPMKETNDDVHRGFIPKRHLLYWSNTGTDEPKAELLVGVAKRRFHGGNRHSSTGAHPFGWHRWSPLADLIHSNVNTLSDIFREDVYVR